jgi:hypothetical protein
VFIVCVVSSVYNLVRGRIGSFRVLLTGELDGWDPATESPLEVTTSPLGSVQDLQRVLERWAQSYLCAVPRLLRAEFAKGATNNDASTFRPEDVSITPIDKLQVPTANKELCFLRAAALFRKLQAADLQVGQYYQVLILNGVVTIKSLVDPSPHRLQSHFRDALLSEEDLNDMAAAIKKAQK